MRTITIHCGNCNGLFDFQHPSITEAIDLRNVSITCGVCQTILVVPKYSVRMESLTEQMVGDLAELGIKPDTHNIGVIDLSD